MGEAVFVKAHGGPEALELREHDPGPPGPGQVRVRVAAAGVNFIDIYYRSGAYAAKPPFVPGVEGAGTIEALGQGVEGMEGVEGLAVGARVGWAQAFGSYSSVLLAPARALVPLPDAVGDELAAAVLLQGMTAHYLTHSVRDPQAGDTVLVHAAAGGTGLLLVQMLVRAGVRVLATCSTEAKAELAREAGASEVIRYTDVDFAEEARRLTAGRGVDAVYDSVGKTTFDGSLACLRRRGLLVLFGQASGAVPPFDLQRLNSGGSLFVTRPTLAHYAATREELVSRAGAVLTAVSNGQLRVRVGARFPLSDAAAAQAALEGRRTTGKVLLQMDGGGEGE